jgi:GNAT superfamily N-acetyltransferase
MIEFIPIDLKVHESHLIELNTEHISWVADVMLEQYNIDVVAILGQSPEEYAKKKVKEFSPFVPPDGIYYLLQLENKIAGMGALRKLKKDIGEVKRMYIRPKFRGKGFGKALLEELLTKGKEFGFSKIILDTGPFMSAAQHIYRLAGFQDREEYPESEVPVEFLPVWSFMEKIL